MEQLEGSFWVNTSEAMPQDAIHPLGEVGFIDLRMDVADQGLCICLWQVTVLAQFVSDPLAVSPISRECLEEFWTDGAETGNCDAEAGMCVQEFGHPVEEGVLLVWLEIREGQTTPYDLPARPQ